MDLLNTVNHSVDTEREELQDFEEDAGCGKGVSQDDLALVTLTREMILLLLVLVDTSKWVLVDEVVLFLPALLGTSRRVDELLLRLVEGLFRVEVIPPTVELERVTGSKVAVLTSLVFLGEAVPVGTVGGRNPELPA